MCKGCGYCKELCPKQVYEFGEEMNAAGYKYMAVVAMDSCIGCRIHDGVPRLCHPG